MTHTTVSFNPDARQREKALQAVWPEVVQACQYGVPGHQWVMVRDQLIERLKHHGFKTKAGGMRGAYQEIDRMMKRVIEGAGKLP